MSRVRGLAPLLALLLAALVGCSAEPDQSGPTVEIIALDHAPVRPIVEQIEDALEPYADQVDIRTIDADSDEGRELLSGAGVEGHAALAVLVNGEIEVEVDGRTVRFDGFPEGESPMPTTEGAWTVPDLETAVAALADAG